MASYEKRSGGWRVRTKGKRESATFPTKAEAQAWAAEREGLYRTLKTGGIESKRLHFVLTRFAEEVSPSRKGERWETLRLAAFKAQLPDKPLPELTPDDLGKWRDARLKSVKPSTFNRELNLLMAVLEHARREWRYLHANPARDVKRPQDPPHRKRLMTDKERDRLCLALGYAGGKPGTISAQVAVMMLLALETAMRAGEVGGLEWNRVHKRHVSLPTTKNGDARDVPLSTQAVELLACMRGVDKLRVFTVGAGSRDSLFRKARERCEIVGLTFHDTRHTAVTRMAKITGMDVLKLAKIIGHRDPKSLMIYFNPSPDELAALLG